MIFFSLLGTVCGVMETIGTFMSFIEYHIEIRNRKLKREYDFLEFGENRLQLKQNFGHVKDARSKLYELCFEKDKIIPEYYLTQS